MLTMIILYETSQCIDSFSFLYHREKQDDLASHVIV